MIKVSRFSEVSKLEMERVAPFIFLRSCLPVIVEWREKAARTPDGGL